MQAYNEQRERAFYMGLSGLGELVQGLEVLMKTTYQWEPLRHGSAQT